MAEQKYKKGDVCSFLLPFQVNKGSNFTHTSIIKPTGSFYIPAESLEQFYKLYEKAVDADEDLYLTEKHRDIGPVLIDLDFRFQKGLTLERKFGDEHIKKIVRLYADVIFKYFEQETFTAYVMLKPNGPVIDKELVKDGIHIVIPDIVSKSPLQYLIRKEVLEKCSEILEDLGLINAYEDVIDEAVIERNNWQMYGSKKPQCESYQVTHIYNVTSTSLEKLKLLEHNYEYVNILSIRNKYNTCKIKEAMKDFVAEYEKSIAVKKTPNPKSALQATKNFKKNICTDNLETIKKLVDILDIKRATNYDDWIRLGWCLRTIDHTLLNTWDIFSKKVPSKYEIDVCEKLWNYMKEDGLGTGTLHMWAKQDNKEAYDKIIKNDLTSLIYASTSKTHHDIAKVVHFIYKYEFVCTSIKQNYWYQFRNHRWMPCDCAHTLRGRLSTEVARKYCDFAAEMSTKAAAEDDADTREKYVEKSKKLLEISLKLKDGPFKENILKECRDLFYIEKFDEKLDSKCSLMGFENGIYDLEALEFREGRPDDYVSYTTGINYIDYDEEHELSKEITDFLEKVIIKAHLREYVLLLLASFLNGGIKEERFHIWTGSGCFAKGTRVLMYDGYVTNVEKIKIGDVLMGDDSTPRVVQQLFRGYSDMYQVTPNPIYYNQPYTVNGQHILVLKCHDPIRIQGAKVSWIVVDNDLILKEKQFVFLREEEANDFVNELYNNSLVIQSLNLLKMTVRQYMMLPATIQSRLYGFRSDLVEFDDQIVDIDPYLIGICVGDVKFSSNKTIPEEYKYNHSEIRLEVLAGIIDVLADYNAKTNQYEIETTNQDLLYDIIWISTSLGIRCINEKSNKICLSGLRLLDIPVREHKKPVFEIDDDATLFYIPFKISRVEDGHFYGFELNDNKMFLLEDFTVVHNSNGKSKTIDLFEQSFGDYCCKLPITLLTQKRAASNAATSELARTKGKRFACLQEPSEDEKLNVGLMKELTGGDKIQARLIYKEPIEFKPQFKMILTCNTLPNVPSDDGGTWRRIRVVEFTSKFCDNPDPQKPCEFKADYELSEKFPVWKEHFMSLLITYYKKYIQYGIIEPDEVLECTKEYQKNNDTFLEFFEQEFEKHEGSYVTYTEIASAFKLWCKENNIHVSTSKKTDFIKTVSKTLGKNGMLGKTEIWKGWRFKNIEEDNDEL